MSLQRERMRDDWRFYFWTSVMFVMALIIRMELS